MTENSLCGQLVCYSHTEVDLNQCLRWRRRKKNHPHAFISILRFLDMPLALTAVREIRFAPCSVSWDLDWIFLDYPTLSNPTMDSVDLDSTFQSISNIGFHGLKNPRKKEGEEGWESIWISWIENNPSNPLDSVDSMDLVDNLDKMDIHGWIGLDKNGLVWIGSRKPV